MNVREIVIAHLKSIGADGLAADGCGCGIDDLAPCGGDITDCKPAKRFDCDGSCSGCCSTGDSDLADACYRSIQNENEPEETHL